MFGIVQRQLNTIKDEDYRSLTVEDVQEYLRDGESQINVTSKRMATKAASNRSVANSI